MSVRICFVAILLGTVVLAAGCGGGGDGAPRVTLTDKSCTYSGARTHEPGVFDIEAENTTSHFAAFAVYELAPGFSIKDVRGFYQRVMVAHDRGEQEVKPPTPDDSLGMRIGAMPTHEQRRSSQSTRRLGDS